MRILFVLICSISLVFLALGAEEGKKKEREQPKKKAPPAGQVSPSAGKATGKPVEAGKAKGAGRPVEAGKAKVKGKPAEVGKPAKVGKAMGAGKPAEAGTATGAGKPVAAGGAAGTKDKPQHFKLANKPKPEVAPPVKFQQNKRIEGAQNWQGSNYQVFRNYKSEWHDRNWWHGHSNRVVFVYGGWYAWNGGYWYPAWGYDPNSYYAYDAPIYAYNNLPPDQVIANVQSALQQQGYYHGEVDGLLGPQTRAAVAGYQRDHGLYTTSTIDQPTLQSLGMA